MGNIERHFIIMSTKDIRTRMHTESYIIVNSQHSRHDKTRLKRAENFIEKNLEKTLSIEQIEKQIGVSQSGVKRLLQRAKKLAVFTPDGQLSQQNNFDRVYTLPESNVARAAID